MEGVIGRVSRILRRWLRAIGFAPAQLKPADHFFRHIKKTWIDVDFVDPAAFRLRTKDNGQIEKGLSVNWVEYFRKPTPQEAIGGLVEVFRKKGRKAGPESRFVLLNVGEAKNAAAKYTTVAVVFDEQKDDPSHALVTGYEKFNDKVAEELAKVIINMFPPSPSK